MSVQLLEKQNASMGFSNKLQSALFEIGKPIEWINSPITTAAIVYLMRKYRELHPNGRVKNGGKWYPAENEHCTCCNNVYQPSCAYPNTLRKHCRTSVHVASLYGIDEKELKKRASEIKKAFEPKDGDICYKVVRVVDGKYLSLHDDTVYEIGVTMRQEAKPDHGGGYYCFRTEMAAIDHYNSYITKEKALLRVRVAGKCIMYGSIVGSKIAVSELTSIEELGREIIS